MKRIPAAKLTDVPPGQCRSVEIEDRCIALFNLNNGDIYALDNTCPHAGGPLGEGTLDGEFVECPWHGWKFNVRTGERKRNPAQEWTVASYPVQTEDGVIQVLIPTD